MNASLNLAELIPPALYLLLLTYLGFRGRNRQAETENYILGGRLLTLPAFVATLVTTWYGGILGVGEYSYLYGISNWFVFGFPYYVFALLFAFFLAPRIRRSNLLSIPDQFFRHYGRASGLVGSVFTFFMTLPAAYVLMLGLLIQFLTGWPLWIGVLLGAIFSMGYVLSGGFTAVVRTDKLQFLLMFGGFIILLFGALHRYGGFAFLRTHLPPDHLTLTGGNSWQYILIWFFIALWTFVDPGFHQRCYAAKTAGTARRGILISVGFWLLFDLLTTTTGLYARAALTDINPALSYPLLARQILSPLMSGVFFTGLLATIMSTVDSLSHLAAVTLGYDLLPKLLVRKRPGLALLHAGLFISGILSIILAVAVPSVLQIWYLIGTVFIPPMLLPLAGCYFPRLRMANRWTLVHLVGTFAVSTAFLGIAVYRSNSLADLQFLWHVQPMYLGLAVSLLLFLLHTAKEQMRNSRENQI